MSEQMTAHHSVILQDRASLELSGVTDVDSFDENEISLYTTLGEMVIRGKALHVNTVNVDTGASVRDVDTGDMQIDGDIHSIVYGDKDRKKKLGFWGKVTR